MAFSWFSRTTLRRTFVAVSVSGWLLSQSGSTPVDARQPRWVAVRQASEQPVPPSPLDNGPGWGQPLVDDGNLVECPQSPHHYHAEACEEVAAEPAYEMEQGYQFDYGDQQPNWGYYPQRAQFGTRGYYDDYSRGANDGQYQSLFQSLRNWFGRNR